MATILGTDRGDSLCGRTAADMFSGLHGDDTLKGFVGVDPLDGGAGIDPGVLRRSRPRELASISRPGARSAARPKATP